MLKYAASALILVAVYFYWDRPKASVPALPSVPKSRSVATPKAPSRPRVQKSAAVPAKHIPPAAKVVSDPNKKYTYPEIQKIIVNDDLCALLKLLNDIRTKEEAPIFVDALFEALNLDHYKGIFGIEGPLFKSQEGKTLSPAQKFLDALATSEFVYGTKREGQTDQEKSLRQLEELVAAYPDNGAYAVYKLALENQMGKTPTQLRETGAKISGTKFFDTHIHDVRAELHKHMWASPTMYNLVRAVTSEIPGIRTHKMRDAMITIEDEKVTEHLGDLLVEKGLNSKRTYLSEEFDASEYYYGNYLLNNKHPDIADLAEAKEPGRIQTIEDDWGSFEPEPETCDRTASDETFNRLKNRF